MYKIEYIGSWKSIPEAAAAIYDSDIPKLEAMLQNGLNLNAPIQFSEHIKLMPLEIAVFQNNVPMIHFRWNAGLILIWQKKVLFCLQPFVAASRMW